MKKTKRLAVISFAASLFLMGAVFVQLTNGDKIKAWPADQGYLELNQTNTPNINIINSDGTNELGQTVELDGDYGTLFKLTNKVSYEVTGEVQSATITPNQTNGTKVYRFNKDTATEKSVRVKNAAVFNGRNIDLKMVIDEIKLAPGSAASHNPYFNFVAVDYKDIANTNNLPASGTTTWGDFFLFVGSANRSASGFNDGYAIDDNISYHYEFYDSESGNPVKDFKGIWNFSNINAVKATSIPHTDNDFSDLYVRTGTKLGIKKNTKAGEATSDYIELYGEGTTANLDTSKFSKKITTDSVAMNMQRKKYSANLNPTPMGILYDQDPIVRIAPSTPIVFGEKNSAKYGEPDYLTMRYSILQTIAKNSENNRNTTFSITTEVPDYYDIDSIKIYEYGSTVEVPASILKVTKNGNKATIEAVNPKADADKNGIDGKVFDIRVESKPNTTFDFATNKDAYGYMSSGEDNGYMTNFEMAGSKTVAHYTFVNTKDPITGELPSKVIEGQTKSKVRYCGVPYADPREDVTFPKGTDFSDFSESEILTGLIENVRTDTENPIDVIKSITIDKDNLPDTSVPGEKVTVIVILETEDGIKTKVPVEVTIGETQSDLVVSFVSDDVPAVTLHSNVSLKGKTIGVPVDLTKEKSVTDAIAAVEALGWDVHTRPAKETAADVVLGGSTEEYVFTRSAANLTVNFVDETSAALPPSVVIPGKVADKVDLTLDLDVQARLAELTAAGYDILTAPTTPAEIGVGGSTVEYVMTRADAKLTVNFMLNDGSTVLKSPVILDAKVGIPVDLTKESLVTAVLADLAAEGYVKQPLANESAVAVARGGSEVTYTFIKAEATLKVQFVDENDQTVRPDVELAKSQNDVVDLTKEDDVKAVLDTLGDYDITPPANETAVTVGKGVTTVKYVVTRAKAAVTVEFVDTGGAELKPTVTLSDKGVGLPLDLTKETTVQSVVDELIAAGYGVTRPSDETAVMVVRGENKVTYVFALGSATLTVRFVDEAGTPIVGYDPIILDHKVGDSVNLKGVQSVLDRLSALDTAGYDLKQTPPNETGVVVNNGGTIVDYVLKKANGKITVSFVTAAGTDAKPSVTLTKDVGTAVDLTLETTVTDVLNTLSGEGYRIVTRPTENLTVTRETIEVEYVVERVEAGLTVRFVDEAGNDIATAITSEQKVGDVVNLTERANVQKQVTDLTQGGYDLPSRPSNEANVVIEQGGTVVLYEFKGKLFFVSAPEMINFGTHKYNATKVRVNDPNCDRKLVVRDTRAVRERWTVFATLQSEMKSMTGTAILNNAIRYVYNGEEKPLNSGARPIMIHTSATKDPFNISDTWASTATGDGLKLEVAPEDVTEAAVTGTQYRGEILWQLAATPE